MESGVTVDDCSGKWAFLPFFFPVVREHGPPCWECAMDETLIFLHCSTDWVTDWVRRRSRHTARHTLKSLENVNEELETQTSAVDEDRYWVSMCWLPEGLRVWSVICVCLYVCRCLNDVTHAQTHTYMLLLLSFLPGLAFCPGSFVKLLFLFHHRLKCTHEWLVQSDPFKIFHYSSLFWPACCLVFVLSSPHLYSQTCSKISLQKQQQQCSFFWINSMSYLSPSVNWAAFVLYVVICLHVSEAVINLFKSKWESVGQTDSRIDIAILRQRNVTAAINHTRLYALWLGKRGKWDLHSQYFWMLGP